MTHWIFVICLNRQRMSDVFDVLHCDSEGVALISSYIVIILQESNHVNYILLICKIFEFIVDSIFYRIK